MPDSGAGSMQFKSRTYKIFHCYQWLATVANLKCEPWWSAFGYHEWAVPSRD